MKIHAGSSTFVITSTSCNDNYWYQTIYYINKSIDHSLNKYKIIIPLLVGVLSSIMLKLLQLCNWLKSILLSFGVLPVYLV